ncbi:MAG: tyrosine-type recombinase/integrase [Methylocystis sp.]|uniref:tyrosine-type recombinase/integrase n=1 Tax=Methylocystis sp. TaxID=1911079 RepID=UPI003DA53540
MQTEAKAKRPAIATVKEVDALKPEAKEFAVKDAKTEGLWLTVKPSGVKSWVLFYSFAGKQRKLTVGPLPLADARKKAAEARILIAEGMDPARAKKAYKAAQTARAQKRRTPALIEGTATCGGDTPMDGGAPPALEHVHDRIEDVVSRFVEEHAKVKTRDWKETARLLNKNVVEAWRGRRLSELEPDDFYELLDEIAERAPIGANRVHAQLSVMCRWASGRKVKLIETNPFVGIEKPTDEKGRSRDRVLTDAELRLVWLASDSLDFPFGPMVKLLILTGARRKEVAGLTWDEIDAGNALEWTVPGSRTKNRHPYIVPISGAALDVLRSLPRFERRHGRTDFALSPGATPPSGFSRAKERLDKIILALQRADDPNGEPLAQWQFHDLRRTFVTNLARFGVLPHVREACVNHVSGHKSGVAGVYDRWEYLDEKRVVFRLLAEHIYSIVSTDIVSASGIAEPV